MLGGCGLSTADSGSAVCVRVPLPNRVYGLVQVSPQSYGKAGEGGGQLVGQWGGRETHHAAPERKGRPPQRASIQQFIQTKCVG